MSAAAANDDTWPTAFDRAVIIASMVVFAIAMLVLSMFVLPLAVWFVAVAVILFVCGTLRKAAPTRLRWAAVGALEVVAQVAALLGLLQWVQAAG